jgi:hypothetical protein
VRLAGDPDNPDWDEDGLSNTWELAYGLDPYSAEGENGAIGDPDVDGMNNADEFSAGTNPRDAASRLEAHLSSLGVDQFTLTWSAVIGKRYQVQRSVGSLTNFVDLPDPNLPRTATSTQESYITSSIPPGNSGVFYRVGIAR